MEGRNDPPSATSSQPPNLVLTSSGTTFANPREPRPPYSPRRGVRDEVRGGLGGTLKTTLETHESGTRFDCVKCGTKVGPDLMLCPPCFAATRTGRRLAGSPSVCPSCGGRLSGGKCGWC